MERKIGEKWSGAGGMNNLIMELEWRKMIET
jgi:hypothetical protein